MPRYRHNFRKLCNPREHLGCPGCSVNCTQTIYVLLILFGPSEPLTSKYIHIMTPCHKHPNAGYLTACSISTMFVSLQRNDCTCFCNTTGSCYEVTRDYVYNIVFTNNSGSILNVAPVNITLNGVKQPNKPFKANESEAPELEYYNMD